MPTPLAPFAITTATRRGFLAALAAAGLLTACGAPATGGPTAATRTVTDLNGRAVDIPARPQRVVALDPNRVVTDLVALGLVPVGATTNPSNPGAGFAETLGAEADGMVSVSATGEADLERVAALTPDLILHAGDYQEIPVERLYAIAPTITYPRAPTGLLEPVRWLGGLLGREEQAARVEQDLRDAVAAQRDAVGLAGRRVAVVDLGDYEPGPLAHVLGPGTNAAEFAELLGAAVAAGGVAYLDVQRAGGNVGVAGVRPGARRPRAAQRRRVVTGHRGARGRSARTRPGSGPSGPISTTASAGAGAARPDRAAPLAGG